MALKPSEMEVVDIMLDRQPGLRYRLRESDAIARAMIAEFVPTLEREFTADAARQTKIDTILKDADVVALSQARGG